MKLLTGMGVKIDYSIFSCTAIIEFFIQFVDQLQLKQQLKLVLLITKQEVKDKDLDLLEEKELTME